MPTRRQRRIPDRSIRRDVSQVHHFRPHPWHGLEVGPDVWGGARDLSDVPTVLVERLQHYFLTYKLVPGQRAHAHIARVYGRHHALKVVRAAMADYDDHFGR